MVSSCSKPKGQAEVVPSEHTMAKRPEADVVKSFKENVSSLMARYEADKHERIEFDYCGTGIERPGYIRASYEPNTLYAVDVRKTDSLVSPYVGILLIEWNKHYSDCEETQEKAQAQSRLGHFGSLKYRYTYAFQDGKWVPTNHEVQGSSGMWESCAEEKAHLAQMRTRYELDVGCFGAILMCTAASVMLQPPQ
jgi:hypothetical protein